MTAQQRIAEGVEGRDLDVRIAVGYELIDPGFHLRRRLVGEGQRQDLFGSRLALGDEMGDPPRDDGRLPGPRAGDDQQRSRIVGDGLSLPPIQAIKNPTRHPRRLYQHHAQAKAR